MQLALANSFEALRDAAGVSIRYVRDGDSIMIIAVPGRTDYETETFGGIYNSDQSRDYLVLGSDLKISGNIILPERGDEIREVIGETDTVFPVLDLGGGRHYSFSDQYRVVIRIHTKQAQ